MCTSLNQSYFNTCTPDFDELPFHHYILLELWLVAALGLGHGAAERGTAWPSLLPASEAQGRSALLQLLRRDAFAQSLALPRGLHVLPWGLHASLQSSSARSALPPLWILLLEGLWSSDRTGHQINSLSARPDVRALVTMNTLLCGHRLWSKTPHVLLVWGLPAELRALPHNAFVGLVEEGGPMQQ